MKLATRWGQILFNGLFIQYCTVLDRWILLRLIRGWIGLNLLLSILGSCLEISYHIVHIYKEYHSLCPLVGIGTLPSPISPASVPLPPEPPKGGAHSPAGAGLWLSQFRRLVKSLCLLCGSYIERRIMADWEEVGKDLLMDCFIVWLTVRRLTSGWMRWSWPLSTLGWTRTSSPLSWKSSGAPLTTRPEGKLSVLGFLNNLWGLGTE